MPDQVVVNNHHVRITPQQVCCLFDLLLSLDKYVRLMPSLCAPNNLAEEGIANCSNRTLFED